MVVVKIFIKLFILKKYMDLFAVCKFSFIYLVLTGSADTSTDDITEYILTKIKVRNNGNNIKNI